MGQQKNQLIYTLKVVYDHKIGKSGTVHKYCLLILTLIVNVILGVRSKN